MVGIKRGENLGEVGPWLKTKSFVQKRLNFISVKLQVKVLVKLLVDLKKGNYDLCFYKIKGFFVHLKLTGMKNYLSEVFSPEIIGVLLLLLIVTFVLRASDCAII